MELGFTWFDFAALAILGLSGVMAFARGLIREVFSIIAFIGGFLAAVFFADMVRPFIESISDLSGPIASVAAGLLIFLIVFILITVVTSAVAKTAHQSTEIGSFDRAAGLAFGVLRGVLVVALFVLLMRQTSPPETGTPAGQQDLEHCIAAHDPFVGAVRCARTYPIYEGVAKGLEVVLPRARQRAHDYIERQKGESAAIPPATSTSTTTTTTTQQPASP
ncbi:CvpA family protein [Terricaulis sp.]|uniref:CvpA family protein n=1 Tax=Terricaulis sp. TaxID=2768686 RepID=UPI003782F0D4